MRLVFEWAMIGAVILLSLRRGIFFLAALLPPRIMPLSKVLPSVAVLIPARNERQFAHRLLRALSQLTYPPSKLSLVLVCDGCTDGTPALYQKWAEQRSDTRVLELPNCVGKAAALNSGFLLANAEIVVVIDADLAPQPDFLTRLVQAFGDPEVGAAAAYLRPLNADENLITRYAAVTSWVHQLVTSAGTDRLGLSPPTLGAAAFRRSALEQIDGFPVLPLGEDIATSASLILRGWRTRFVREAIADNTLVSDGRDYWRQHIRWARAAFRAYANNKPQSLASPLQRLEIGVASTGYADRFVFAIAAAGALVGLLPLWIPVLYLAVPGLETVVAPLKAGIGRNLPRFLIAMISFFAVDIAASIVAMAMDVMHRPYQWHSSRWTPEESNLTQ